MTRLDYQEVGLLHREAPEKAVFTMNIYVYPWPGGGGGGGGGGRLIIISFNLLSVVRMVCRKINCAALVCREFNLFLMMSLHSSHLTDA